MTFHCWYSVVGHSGQTSTEYPLHIISYIIRWHSIVGYSGHFARNTQRPKYPTFLLGILVVGYSVQLPMRFHCWVFRRWAFHCWVFRSFCPEYPTFLLGIVVVGYSVQLPHFAHLPWYDFVARNVSLLNIHSFQQSAHVCYVYKYHLLWFSLTYIKTFKSTKNYRLPSAKRNGSKDYKHIPTLYRYKIELIHVKSWNTFYFARSKLSCQLQY